MNLAELKQDFYKRFETSDNFLYFTSAGILYTLLGYTEIDGAPSITSQLSMKVQMFARRLGANMIKLEKTDSDKCFVYRFKQMPEFFSGNEKYAAELFEALSKHKLQGAEILYDTSIPEFLSDTEPFLIALAQAAMNMCRTDYSKQDIAALCADNANINECLGILYAKKGYCTLMNGGIPKNVPLPLSGYKILSVHCLEKDKNRSPRIKAAFEKVCRLYPHINSISSLTEREVNASEKIIKDKTALKYLYHISEENRRISSAASALQRCNIKTLFLEMNRSQKSMERFWNLGNEHIFLARCAESIDGIAAVRSWRNGVAAVIEEDKVDYAIEMIRCEFENNIGYMPTFCVCDPF